MKRSARDEDGKVYEAPGNMTYRQWIDNAAAFKRKDTDARSSINRLKKFTSSDILNLKTDKDVKDYFNLNYEIKVKNSENCKLDDVKAVLSGVDDLAKEFKSANVGNSIEQIIFEPDSKRYAGEYNYGTGVLKIFKDGIGDYFTGYHEAAHALDCAMLNKKDSFSETIIKQAENNLLHNKKLGLTVSDIYTLKDDIYYDDSSNNYEEIFAYAFEKVKRGTDNQLAEEIHKLTEAMS